jgi:hypothetical protein
MTERFAEAPQIKKLSHSEVFYQHPSQQDDEKCADCKHFIDAKPARCEHVKSPIRPEDWCRKFERK